MRINRCGSIEFDYDDSKDVRLTHAAGGYVSVSLNGEELGEISLDRLERLIEEEGTPENNLVH